MPEAKYIDKLSYLESVFIHASKEFMLLMCPFVTLLHVLMVHMKAHSEQTLLPFHGGRDLYDR